MAADDAESTAAQTDDATVDASPAAAGTTHEPVADRPADRRAADPLASLERTVSTDDSGGRTDGPALVPRGAQTRSSDVADWAADAPQDRRTDIVPPVIGADT